MQKDSARRLTFHAAGVILIGMLAGIPLAMSLLGTSNTNPEDWKLAHMEGVINGLLMLAAAAAGHLLTLGKTQEKLLLFSLVFTGYSNALYGWVRGLSGQAGLDFAPPLSNQLASLLGGLPVITALLALCLILLGARKRS